MRRDFSKSYIRTTRSSIQTNVKRGLALALPLSAPDLISRSPNQRLAPDFCEDRGTIERELDILVPNARRTNIVVDAMRYAVFGGGQRIRPILSLRIARILGKETRSVLRAAAATELVHCASLIVDDLPCMDDSPTRRGLPSVHVRFGEATAILAAFSLVATAARFTVAPEDGRDAESTHGLRRFQCRLLGALDPSSLIRGQALDLGSPNPARSELITELKTVPLFELAVEAGTVSSPDFARREAELRRFARAFGLAFQMVDDFLDGDASTLQPVLDQLEKARCAVDRLGPRRRGLTELIDYLATRLNAEESRAS